MTTAKILVRFSLCAALAMTVTQGAFAQDASKIAADQRELSLVGLKLSRAFSAFCTPGPRAGFLLTRGSGPKHDTVLMVDVQEGGPAYVAGIREGDTLLKVDGQEIFDADGIAGVARGVFRSALEASHLSGKPVRLLTIRAGATSPQIIDITPELNCGYQVRFSEQFSGSESVSTSHVHVRGEGKGIAADALAFRVARHISLTLSVPESPTDSDATLQGFAMVLSLLSGATSRPFLPPARFAPSSPQYSQADLLRADFFAALVLRKAGYSIDDYVARAELMDDERRGVDMTESRKTVFRPKRSDDERARLEELISLVKRDDLKGAIALVKLETPALVAAALKYDTASNDQEMRSIPRPRPDPEKTEPATPIKLEIQASVQTEPSHVRAASEGVGASVPSNDTPAGLVVSAVVSPPVLPVHSRRVPMASAYAKHESVDAVPVNESGRKRYGEYLTKPSPKAAVVYENGRLRYSQGTEHAMLNLLDGCAREGRRCWLYAVDDRVVWQPSVEKRIGRADQLERVP